MTLAIEKLQISYNQDISALQTKLDEAEASHAISRQSLLSDMDNVQDKLDQCQAQ